MIEELGVAARRFNVIGGGGEEPEAPVRGGSSPVPLIRKLLGSHLRGLREARRLRGQDVTRLGAITSTSKLSRIENGDAKVALDEPLLLGLLACYGVEEGSGDHRAVMQRWAQLSSARLPWWDAYHDVLQAEFSDLLYMESLASKITVYEASYMPGLLQTPHYMAAVMELPFRGVPADRERIRLRREVRRKRQQLLEFADGRGVPELTVFIDEAVTFRPYGGITVLREQLRHLFSVCENQEQVHIRVFPLAAHADAGPLSPSMTLLEFPAEQQMPEALYVEAPNVTATWVVDDNQLELHRAALLGVSQHALSKAQTLDFLESRLKELEELP